MKKAEVLILSDLHLKVDNIEVVESIFKQAISICKKKGIKDMILAGDMFDSRSQQPLEVLNSCRKIFNSVSGEGIILHTIHGNHDQKNQDSIVSYLLIFNKIVNHYPKFKVKKIGSFEYHFLPFFKSNNLYLKYLNSLKKEIKDNSILITHKDFNGAKNNDGSLVDSGISASDVKKYKYVLVGHYHDPNLIGKNIRYVGAAFQHNFGETEEKGFTIVNSDGSLNFIQSNFPKFIKQKFLLEEFSKEDCRELAKKYKGGDSKVRMVFVGEEYDLNKIDKGLLKEAGIDVKFERGNKLTEDDLTEEKIMSHPIKHDRKSLLKSFINYSKVNNFNSGQTSGMLKLLQDNY